ncbi:MAG: RNA recognition motif-containing protein [Rickettsiales bacterium]|jgi:RNA recognition motif-containing protein
MNINILNLSRKITVEELSELFKAYGMVESCDIVVDKQSGKSKGFGFVKMLNHDEANDAIKSLHGKKIDGNKIRVKISNKTK